jgi:23S rRNA pseudouridine2457 synthase
MQDRRIVFARIAAQPDNDAMRLILINKPFQVLTAFRSDSGRPTLAGLLHAPGCHPAGRLDHDSEGLLLLTDDGPLQARLSDPRFKLPKIYFVQVEGDPRDEALARLRGGVALREGPTRPAEVARVAAPDWLWSRDPPIRFRRAIPTAWLRITLTEGRNRQVRRMTAHVGHPTLRLIRWSVGPFNLGGLAPGQWRDATREELSRLHALPKARPGAQAPRGRPPRNLRTS